MYKCTRIYGMLSKNVRDSFNICIPCDKIPFEMKPGVVLYFIVQNTVLTSPPQIRYFRKSLFSQNITMYYPLECE